MASMQTEETINEILKDIKLLLQKGGKDIVLVRATESAAHFRLEGFCSGCGCGDSYREGILEMISEKMPHVSVSFE